MPLAQAPRTDEIVHGRYSSYTKKGCRCVACTAANTAHQAEWKAKNPGRKYRLSEASKKKAYQRQLRWKRANRARVNAQSRRWAKANPTKRRRSTEAWRLANVAKGREYAARRRAKKKGAECRPILQRDLDRLLVIHGGLCAYCKETQFEEWDHVVPLARGGRHAIGNLAPACRHCNRTKSDHWLAAWRRQTETDRRRAA